MFWRRTQKCSQCGHAAFWLRSLTLHCEWCAQRQRAAYRETELLGRIAELERRLEQLGEKENQ